MRKIVGETLEAALASKLTDGPLIDKLAEALAPKIAAAISASALVSAEAKPPAAAPAPAAPAASAAAAPATAAPAAAAEVSSTSVVDKTDILSEATAALSPEDFADDELSTTQA